jgi:hypothetical protein
MAILFCLTMRGLGRYIELRRLEKATGKRSPEHPGVREHGLAAGVGGSR